MSDLIVAISPQQLAHILQQAGYRANEVSNGQIVQIQSAAQGIGFVINFGNTVSEQNRDFVDFSFNCTLNIIPTRSMAGFGDGCHGCRWC